jgi:hypothetical protein
MQPSEMTRPQLVAALRRLGYRTEQIAGEQNRTIVDEVRARLAEREDPAARELLVTLIESANAFVGRCVEAGVDQRLRSGWLADSEGVDDDTWAESLQEIREAMWRQALSYAGDDVECFACKRRKREKGEPRCFACERRVRIEENLRDWITRRRRQVDLGSRDEVRRVRDVSMRDVDIGQRPCARRQSIECEVDASAKRLEAKIGRPLTRQEIGQLREFIEADRDDNVAAVDGLDESASRDSADYVEDAGFYAEGCRRISAGDQDDQD